MLSVEGLTIAYGAITGVDDVTLRVGEGEIVTVIGANGAGKSTLLRAIAGFHRPRQGSITFEGRPLAGLSPGRVRELGISLVPEGRQMWPALTVEEHLRLGLYTRRRERAEHRSRIEEMYALFPVLAERRRQRAGSLSGGEQQMVAIARALVAGPRLVLLDEPTLGLAPIVLDRITETLRTLRDQGTTMLLVEQNARFAFALADRGYVLEVGRVTLEGDRDQLASSEQLIDAYLGVSLTDTAPPPPS
jgi:branched-chain amino acid transport system ATP-binding protein